MHTHTYTHIHTHKYTHLHTHTHLLYLCEKQNPCGCMTHKQMISIQTQLISDPITVLPTKNLCLFLTHTHLLYLCERHTPYGCVGPCVCQNFSKVSSIVIVHGIFCSRLTFENFCLSRCVAAVGVCFQSLTSLPVCGVRDRARVHAHGSACACAHE